MFGGLFVFGGFLLVFDVIRSSVDCCFNRISIFIISFGFIKFINYVIGFVVGLEREMVGRS